jgi:hypothetical protein
VVPGVRWMSAARPRYERRRVAERRRSMAIGWRRLGCLPAAFRAGVLE